VSGIVWLASYPRSGNTWLRIFLANFLGDEDRPADINNLNIWGISSDRRTADDSLGVECSDLTPAEIDRYRPAVYRDIANRSQKTLFIKAHDAYILNSDTEPLIPLDVTKAAIYVVRNPLDVAVSYAHHEAITLDHAIDRMRRETMTKAKPDERLHVQLQQRLLSWSRHVLSWLDQCAIRLRVMRYEDMCRQPVEAFGDAVRFLGLEDDVERVRRAVGFSSFEILRQQELRHGFKEKPLGAEAFFRSGRAGSWRDTLTDKQVERLVADHGAVMRRLGYLSEKGRIECS
jgi:aryl sulfotransferase